MKNPEMPDTYGGGYSVMPTHMKIHVRDTLNTVEWVRLSASHEYLLCPLCGGMKTEGHIVGCDLKKAIDIMRIGGTEK